MARTSLIKPGDCFAAKDPDGGVWAALRPAGSSSWELLVLVEDLRYDEVAGSVDYGSSDWLLDACVRIT